MKEIKIELRTTIPAAAIHAALAELSDRCVGRTESIAISEQAVALPARATAATGRRLQPDHRHAELIYHTDAGKTRTIDVDRSLRQNGITEIDAFLGLAQRRGSWEHALKKAALHKRRLATGNGSLPLQPPLRVQF